MLKFALIMNSNTYTSDEYSGTLSGEKFTAYTCAVNSMDLACQKVKELSEKDFDFIDLCGDFDDEKAEEIRKFATGKTKVNNVRYTETEAKKLEKSENFNPFGFIFQAEGADPTIHTLTLKGEEYDTVFTGVDTIEQACEQAKRMVAAGIAFIEVCGWFESEKVKNIIQSIGGQVPVASAHV